MKLVKAFGIALVVLILIIYVPKINSIFLTQPLDIYDWLMTLVAAGIYAAFRMTKRHTRKHTRHSILKLYKEHGLKI